MFSVPIKQCPEVLCLGLVQFEVSMTLISCDLVVMGLNEPQLGHNVIMNKVFPLC